jgi:two-component system, chemotaxis family, CheB/CheR fusion protein
VVDRDGAVQVWNPSSTDMWGLRSDEAEGRRFLDLDIGLPTDQLAGPLRAALASDPEGHQLTVEAVDRRGRPIVCDIRIAPLTSLNGDHYGALMLTTGRRPDNAC